MVGGGGGGRGGRKVAEQWSTLDKLEVSGPHHLSSVTGRVFSLQGRIMHETNGGGGGGGTGGTGKGGGGGGTGGDGEGGGGRASALPQTAYNPIPRPARLDKRGYEAVWSSGKALVRLVGGRMRFDSRLRLCFLFKSCGLWTPFCDPPPHPYCHNWLLHRSPKIVS